MSAVARVQAYADAFTSYVREVTGDLGSNALITSTWDRCRDDVVPLQLDDLHAVLARLAEVCPDHVACEACERPLCRECNVGEPASCGHQDAELLCDECAPDECRECRSLIRAEYQIDRHFRNVS